MKKIMLIFVLAILLGTKAFSQVAINVPKLSSVAMFYRDELPETFGIIADHADARDGDLFSTINYINSQVESLDKLVDMWFTLKRRQKIYFHEALHKYNDPTCENVDDSINKHLSILMVHTDWNKVLQDLKAKQL